MTRVVSVSRPGPAGWAVIALVLLAVVAVVAADPAPRRAVPARTVSVAPPTRPGPPGGVLAYLRRISGARTLSGQYNRQPLDEPAMWTRKAHDITGRWPAVWGHDFEFEAPEIEARTTMIDEAVRQWNAGSLVTLSWHVCPPTVPEPCDWKTDIQSDLTAAQWTELTTDGTSLNTAWKARLDVVVPHLERLQRAGIEVLFRPLHEINEPAFWWGHRPGPAGSSLLYRITRDHLLSRGLTSLIWVWSVDDATPAAELAAYHPGGDQMDVLGLDPYRTGFPPADYYTALLDLADGKPVALTEVPTVPAPEQLAGQPRWTYWLPWAEFLVDPRHNSDEAVKRTYHDGRTVNREELIPLRGPG